MRRAVLKLMPGKRLPDSAYKIDHNSVEDFYIALDSPHKLWIPGEEISGQVILISRKDLANIAITFSLSGCVRINALPQLKLRAVKHVLFNHTIRIYGPEEAQPDSFVNGLYKGEHRFPFIVKLPTKKVFTSIDFGKGAIVYSLKAALRGADAVADSPLPGQLPGGPDLLFRSNPFSRLHLPSYLLEKTIQLVDPIDVAGLPAPKPKRLIIKDPRRTRKLQRVHSTTLTQTFLTLLSNNLDLDSTSLSVMPTSANTPNLVHHQTPNLVHHQSPMSLAYLPMLDGPNNIRVTMEVAQRGFLRGELIPIKLHINHLKKIQDSKGIIVTLVRVCRLDYGPDGFFESFRKDLQQLVIPLFVDPATFALEISTSLRVPPDAFPTISGCPMVSFQYFIEVMLNLSGKSLSLEGPSEHPKLTLAPRDELPTGVSPNGNYNFHPYASRSDFINTDKFKRLNKFVQITTEVIIGTHRLEKPVVSSPEASVAANSPVPHPERVERVLPSGINPVPETSPINDFSIPPYLETPSTASPFVAEGQSGNVPTYDDVAPSVPSPDRPVLSEKERMRQHEASLMPSEPHFDNSDDDDRDTVSPVEPSGLLDLMGDQPAPSLSDNYDYFGADRDRAAIPEEDDLYEASDLHEGIGLEGAKDYVPNYDTAANDRLVTAGSRSQNGRP